MAPEQIRLISLDKSDVYACGIILYFFLSGKFPFDGNTEKQMLNDIFKGQILFEDSEWNQISLLAKDLINNMTLY